MIKPLGLYIVTILFFTGCSHLATVDRALVNRPSMNLGVSLTATNQASLTNQKSSKSLSIGSCSVCAH